MADDSVELIPDKVLTFTWDTGADTPQTVLRAANGNAAKYFVYKVKTTAPKRYVVRPPQGCIEPSGQAAIKLTMVAKDAEALWGEALEEQRQGLTGDVKCDDKFLVQTAEVSAAYFEQELKGKDDKALSPTLAKLWKQLGDEDKAGGAPKKVKSAKLTTRFVFPKAMSQAASNSVLEATAPSAPPATPASTAPAAAPPASFVADKNNPVAHSAAPEAETLFAEFSALRKKYDDLVAYTVVLTGERDFLQQDCKDKEDALKKASAAATAAAAAAPAAAGGPAGGTASGSGGVVIKDSTGPAGMSFSQVIAVALLAFVVGRILA